MADFYALASCFFIAATLGIGIFIIPKITDLAKKIHEYNERNDAQRMRISDLVYKIDNLENQLKKQAAQSAQEEVGQGIEWHSMEAEYPRDGHDWAKKMLVYRPSITPATYLGRFVTDDSGHSFGNITHWARYPEFKK